MEIYDALTAPDPKEWLETDEYEQLDLVEDYHRRVRAPLSRSQRTLHANLHVVIENQIAAADPALAGQTVERLMKEGLDRHEAVHAVAAIMAVKIQEVVHNNKLFDQPDYLTQLERLSAERWRRQDE